MDNLKNKTSKFALEVQEWAGNSPLKASTFGGICGITGYLLNIWPL